MCHLVHRITRSKPTLQHHDNLAGPIIHPVKARTRATARKGRPTEAALFSPAHQSVTT